MSLREAQPAPARTFLPLAISWKVGAAVIWLVFSVALACWLMIFGLGQIDRLSELTQGQASAVAQEIARDVVRRHRMLLSEGATLVLLLLGGGLALLYHVRIEAQRARRLRDFFASFTHDLKTSLASLRLQAESLEEDAKGSGHEELLRRLVKDTVRLELQLENSLLLASPEDSDRILLEPIRLVRVLEPMAMQWPELELAISGDATVMADHRALESMFKNFLQNSVVHGRSRRVFVEIKNEDRVTIRFQDDGRGFKGDLQRLGRMFERHGTSSGSGLGLYLAMSLARRLDGEVRVLPTESGFAVEVILPRAGGPP